jgi:hypothetical protein
MGVTLLDLSHIAFTLSILFLGCILAILWGESQHGLVEDGSTIQYVVAVSPTAIRLGPLYQIRQDLPFALVVTVPVALGGLTIALAYVQVFLSAPVGFLGRRRGWDDH